MMSVRRIPKGVSDHRDQPLNDFGHAAIVHRAEREERILGRSFESEGATVDGTVVKDKKPAAAINQRAPIKFAIDKLGPINIDRDALKLLTANRAFKFPIHFPNPIVQHREANS